LGPLVLFAAETFGKTGFIIVQSVEDDNIINKVFISHTTHILVRDSYLKL